MRKYPTLEQGIADITDTIQRKMEARGYRAANELRSSALPGAAGPEEWTAL